MNAKDRKRARELLAIRTLTHAPWLAEHDDEGSTIVGNGRVVARLPYNRNPFDHDDAELIAASRTLLPAALDRIDELERALTDAFNIARCYVSESDHEQRHDDERRLHELQAILDKGRGE